MTLRTHRRVAAVLFLATGSICQMASATTHTWKSADGTWGDATKWSSLPNGTSAEAFVGNGGTVSIAGGIFNTSSLHVGYVGTNNSGTGKIIVDSGSLTANRTGLMGEGNAGSLIINGGAFTVDGD